MRIRALFTATTKPVPVTFYAERQRYGATSCTRGSVPDSDNLFTLLSAGEVPVKLDKKLLIYFAASANQNYAAPVPASQHFVFNLLIIIRGFLFSCCTV
jgi:hypothetical protein